MPGDQQDLQALQAQIDDLKTELKEAKDTSQALKESNTSLHAAMEALKISPTHGGDVAPSLGQKYGWMHFNHWALWSQVDGGRALRSTIENALRDSNVGPKDRDSLLDEFGYVVVPHLVDPTSAALVTFKGYRDRVYEAIFRTQPHAKLPGVMASLRLGLGGHGMPSDVQVAARNALSVARAGGGRVTDADLDGVASAPAPAQAPPGGTH